MYHINLSSSAFFRPKYLLPLFVSMHVAGAIGLLIPETQTYFQALTPLNLLFANGILFGLAENKQAAFFRFALICYSVGLLAEMVGTNTGIIFGNYSYGHTLGWKLWNTPLTIGLNWFGLIYSASFLLDKVRLPKIMKALLVATMLVVLDLFIEPVAIHLDFWHWSSADVPIHNYLGWFVIAFSLSYFYFQTINVHKNPLAHIFFLVQCFFFIFLWNML
ncbi:carotenoid biosynthesis protein [Persicobacter psychrovividus]|uniref:Carotenoid biosynthesis protein n=1 Tax=Persicobacter psychrovividus TaxID=387638 RepID=A0ABN6L456_9BACT|nr:hypothetical protein PEPS_01600 [Persicobacter psychrovividus]